MLYVRVRKETPKSHCTSNTVLKTWYILWDLTDQILMNLSHFWSFLLLRKLCSHFPAIPFVMIVYGKSLVQLVCIMWSCNTNYAKISPQSSASPGLGRDAEIDRMGRAENFPLFRVHTLLLFQDGYPHVTLVVQALKSRYRQQWTLAELIVLVLIFILFYFI